MDVHHVASSSHCGLAPKRPFRSDQGLRGTVWQNPGRPSRACRHIILVDSPTPIFTISTPYSGASMVTLHKHVWEKHILPYRPFLHGRQEWISHTLASPTVVCAGTTNPQHVASVNSNIISAGSNSPFAVFVHPVNQMVVSAGYRRDFRDLTSHTVLWLPNQGRT